MCPGIYIPHLFYVDGCEAETTDGGYEWVETDLGDYATSDCPCAEYLLSLAGSAFRFCGGDYGNGAQWSDQVDVTGCVALSSDTTRRLCQAIIVSVLLKNNLQDEISHQLS